MPLDASVLGPPLTPGRHHFFTERATELVYAKIIQPGDTVFDLGANRAHHTVKLLERVGEAGRVHAFEPNPDLQTGLAGLAANLRLWPFAVGDRLEMVELYVPEGMDGWSSLQDIRGDLPDRAFRIRSTVQIAIDEVPELRDLDVSFVKIDVERREREAIRGMRELLRRSKPVVICEGNIQDNFAALNEIGYRCFDFFGQPATPDNILANFLACPPAWLDRLESILPTPAEWNGAIEVAAAL